MNLFVNKLLNRGDKRSVLIKKNILFSLFLKIIGMIVMFTLIPLSINYLGDINYGIWITISTLIAWTGMFDFGLAHGLRNRLTETLAKKDDIKGRYLVSSSYFFIFLIAIFLLILFLPILSSINWQNILNLSITYNTDILSMTILLIFILFIIQFILKPITAILQAHQLPAIAQAMGTLSGVIIVIIIFILSTYTSPYSNLFLYALIVAGVPIIVSILTTIYLFHKNFHTLRPSFKFIKFKYIKSIGGLGLSFFMIQLSLLFVYSSDNLIISYLFGPQEVTTYNVVFRYFSILTIFFGVIMTPFWSAITDAYSKNEMPWIEKNIKILFFILLIGIFIDLILLFGSSWVFKQWISEDFIVSTQLVTLMALYVICMGWLNIFSYFSNGIGKIRVQMIAYMIVAILNIPLSYYFGKILQMGVSGVLLATITSMIIVSSVLTIQYYKIINNKAVGLWNR